MNVEAQDVDSLERSRKYIYSMDLSQIIDKMVSHQKWRREEAESVSVFYRNFLFLNLKYADKAPLPPSDDIDEFWHNHILDTEKYHSDSQAIFGKYFHHYPYLGIDGKTTMHDLVQFFNETQQLHYQEFGEHIYAIKRNFFVAWILRLFSKKSEAGFSISDEPKEVSV